MTEGHHYDLIVIGAGIVGATLACKLLQENPGLHVALVEAQAFRPREPGAGIDSRVVALTLDSQRELESLSVWPAVAAVRACPFTRMEVWEGTGTGSIHFDCRDVGEIALGYIVENAVLVDALLQRLSALSGLHLFCPARVSAINLPSPGEPGLVILEDGSSLRSPLIVATDGANSPVRTMANLETREWAYGHTAIVSTVTTELSHNATAWQRFTEKGPLAFLPLDSGDGSTTQCSIVWSVESAIAHDLLLLPDSEFLVALGRAFEHRLGAVLHATPRLHFPLIQRHCKQYYKPGVVVAGDAAHTIHPLAGQGVNLGLQDVVALGEEIHRARQRNIPLSDVSILERYQRRRLGPNLAMMGVMEGFKQLFSQDALPLRWLRNEGMKQIDRAGIIKSRLIREAMGI